MMKMATRSLTNPTSHTSCPMIAMTKLDMDEPNAGMMFVQKTGRFLTIVALRLIPGVSPQIGDHAAMSVKEDFANALILINCD